MSLIADNNGQIKGKFTIPAGVPAGRKEVRVVGNQGNVGGAMFVGDGVVTNQVYQRKTTTIIERYDPLAQTFTLSQAEQLKAFEVFFTAIGTKPVRVQLRETGFGVPSQVVLGEAILAASAMVENAWNRFTFASPVSVSPNVEYALVVLSDDAAPAAGIAELGKYDSSSGRYVTSQPYQVGVLLSSSNASTWTPHQDRDLSFRLLGMRYTEPNRLITLGTVAVNNVTELRLQGQIEAPVPGATGNYQLVLPDGTTYNVGAGQILSLASPITGNVTVKAFVSSTAEHSAVLYPGTLLAAGALAGTADYVTPAMDADVTGTNARLIFDAIIPSGATVKAYYSGIDAGDVWTLIPADAAAPVPLGDNLYEYTFVASDITEARLRFKLVLTGTPAARPRVRNLRISLT